MEHHAFIARTQDDNVLAIVHGKLGNAQIAGFLQSVEQQRVRLFARLFRSHVIRRFEVDRIDLGRLHEFQDLHHLGRRRCDFLDIGVVDHHIAVFFVFVAFDDFVARDRLVLSRAEQHLANARAVRLVQLIKVDALAARGAVQFDRERDQPERQVPFPNGGCHGQYLAMQNLQPATVHFSNIPQTFSGIYGSGKCSAENEHFCGLRKHLPLSSRAKSRDLLLASAAH